MTIEALYEDDAFNDLLVKYASKRGIYEFDDYKQDVFLMILETGASGRKDFNRIADRVAKRYSRAYVGDDAMSFAYSDDDGAIESMEDSMSRMVYEGRAVKVS